MSIASGKITHYSVKHNIWTYKKYGYVILDNGQQQFRLTDEKLILRNFEKNLWVTVIKKENKIKSVIEI